MHVLEIAGPLEFATFDFAANLLHAMLDRRDVGRRQHPRRSEHPGMGNRCGNVRIGEPLVEIDRCSVQLDEFSDRFAEAAGPAARALVVGIVCAH